VFIYVFRASIIPLSGLSVCFYLVFIFWGGSN